MEVISRFVNRRSLTLVVSILILLSRIVWLEMENGALPETVFSRLENCLRA